VLKVGKNIPSVRVIANVVTASFVISKPMARNECSNIYDISERGSKDACSDATLRRTFIRMETMVWYNG